MPGRANVSKPKRPKNLTQTKIELQGPDRGRRYVLADIAATRATARGRTTTLLKGGYKPSVSTGETWKKEGETLKAGVTAIAARANIDAVKYAKLERMDPEKLRAMYDDNKLIYEAYFSYEGINWDGRQWIANEGAKTADVDFLIEQYERLFGRLGP